MGKRYLIGCALVATLGLAWAGYQYYRWAVVNFDNQELEA